YSVIATAFAVIVCKAVFGGLGHNIFNPAMGGYIFVLISCPGIMGASYIAPAPYAYTQASVSETFDVIYRQNDLQRVKNQVESLNLTDNSNDNEYANNSDDLLSKLDGFTGATYLENIKASRKTGKLHTVEGHDFTQSSYQAYLALAVAYLLGGLVLMALRIILIKMVLVFFVSLTIFSYIFSHYFPGYFMNPLDTVIFGGTMIGAFFIITDPVTNAGTSKGRVCFSVLAAFLIVILRAFGSYSDAVAFAVLLSNSAAPLIDQLTYRRSYGYKYKKGALK
ncbi:MAG: RnfABCDGE type electron transport complex subunit D, partial [Succinivibrio sp.]